MKITNKLNLPKPFVDAVSRNYQYKDKRYSVTEMLKGYKEIILTRRHFDEMEQDVADSIWLIFGTAVHKVLEDAKEAEDELKETKIHYEFPNGYTLSGQQDLYSESLKRVTDYKTGTVWKVIYDEWDDYRTQCLDYAILFRKIGFDVTNAEIVMVLKDWSATKAKTTPGYPEFPVYVKHFDFTEEEFEAEEKRIVEKFNELDKLNGLDADLIPPCTETERWATKTKYAVMKKGRKTAVKLFDDEFAARQMVQNGGGDYVDIRPGEDRKCLEYCNCCKWCSYYKEHYGQADEGSADTAES